MVSIGRSGTVRRLAIGGQKPKVTLFASVVLGGAERLSARFFDQRHGGWHEKAPPGGGGAFAEPLSFGSRKG
jgi:hypothetical protein